MAINRTYHRPLRAVRTEYNGRVYPSKMEAKRAAELDLLMRAGEVAWWLPQVTIPLGPDHSYRIDFLVADFVGDQFRPVVLIHAEDVKAVRTREQATHERMWRKYGPFELRIITKSGVEVIEGGGA